MKAFKISMKYGGYYIVCAENLVEALDLVEEEDVFETRFMRLAECRSVFIPEGDKIKVRSVEEIIKDKATPSVLYHFDPN